MNTAIESHEIDAMETVKRFLDAWARQDSDSVVNAFDENATFHASAGSAPGQAYVGRDQFAPAIQAMLEKAGGVVFEVTEMIPFDGGVVATWCATSQSADNTSVRAPGIDIFRVRDGKITLKDAYRKLKT